jgi:type IV pilus assembly protein PilN
MTMRINLLPHREMRRERRKKDFVGLISLVGLGAAVAAVVVALAIDQRIDAQRARNDFIKAENRKLDEQIKEIATLRAEIDSLRARQEAVESLQANRTVPVHLMDELVKHTPEGIHLKTMRQDQTKVTLIGYAQSNERVSELLRNLGNHTPWLERPELMEIKAVRTAAPGGGKDARGQSESRRVFEFSLNALVKTTERPATRPAPKTTSAPARVASAGTAANR